MSFVCRLFLEATILPKNFTLKIIKQKRKIHFIRAFFIYYLRVKITARIIRLGLSLS